MQRVTLLCVGRIGSAWLATGCSDYLRRFHGRLHVDVLELPASKERDARRQVADESVRLLQAAEKLGGERWILDERGIRITSDGFAAMLGTAKDHGSAVTFLLGGAHGMNEELRRTGQTIRLSDMTLPHELCRLVFLEQLYRATEILRGSGYHH